MEHVFTRMESGNGRCVGALTALWPRAPPARAAAIPASGVGGTARNRYASHRLARSRSVQLVPRVAQGLLHIRTPLAPFPPQRGEGQGMGALLRDQVCNHSLVSPPRAML